MSVSGRSSNEAGWPLPAERPRKGMGVGSNPTGPIYYSEEVER